MPVLLFEGRQIQAAEGQSVAAALLAHGVRLLGRSAKYHRPRGVRCANGTCSCCAMRVDGLPGVRTCVTPVLDGMTVEREHAWPSADVDLLRVAEFAGPALHAGVYYRWFRRSPRLWGLTERLLAAGAGQGRLPTPEAAARFAGARCIARRDVEVLVVGGGGAGLSAGLAAARAGAQTLLVERHHALGGGLAADAAFSPEAAALLGLCSAAGGRDVATALTEQAEAQPGLEIVVGAEVAGWYEEGSIAYVRGLDLTLCEPRAVVLATGSHEVVPPFVNGDLPGVMTGGAVQRLLTTHGVKPGRVATVLANDARGYAVAAQLTTAGVEVVCVADQRPASRVPVAERRVAADLGISVLAGVRGVSAHGLNAVRAVTLRTEPEGAVSARSVRLTSDLVCVCLGVRPADELARQAFVRGRFALAGADAQHGGSASSAADAAQPVAAPGGVAFFIAGGVGREWAAAAAIAGGLIAGRAAAQSI